MNTTLQTSQKSWIASGMFINFCFSYFPSCQIKLKMRLTYLRIPVSYFRLFMFLGELQPPTCFVSGFGMVFLRGFASHQVWFFLYLPSPKSKNPVMRSLERIMFALFWIIFWCVFLFSLPKLCKTSPFLICQPALFETPRHVRVHSGVVAASGAEGQRHRHQRQRAAPAGAPAPLVADGGREPSISSGRLGSQWV